MKRASDPAAYSKTFNLEASACTLCTNRDNTRIAVGGRKVFKILNADQEDFRVLANFRDLPFKQINLNYTSNHIQWNPRDENQLASAPTNGSVVLWDIKKNTKSKLAHVYDKIHQRASNRICYHPREPYTLISGSQDSSMIILDTRQKISVAKLMGPDSVRDVQFSPFNEYLILAAFENGSCQIWDRRNDTARRSVNAHMGPSYSCAWHLELENRFLSAGRDKTIKIFDIQTVDKPREVYVVNALFSVAHAGWRPNHKNHITSCSHLFDNSVAVWDIRRPFIQYASFLEHTDDVTDFLWLSEDILLSCGKDGRLIQRHVSTATHQTDRAAPISISLRPDGRGLALSSSDALSQKGKTYQTLSASRNPAQFRKQDNDPYQRLFLKHTSFLQEHQQKETNNSWLDMFKICAKNFKFEGQPPDSLCDHNYQVCVSVNRKEEAWCWIILKLLYCGLTPGGCSPLCLLQVAPPTDGNSEPISSTNVSEKESTKCEKENTNSDKKKGSVEDVMTEENNHDIAGMLEFFEQRDNDDSGSSTTESTQPELELPKEPFQLRQDIDTKSHLLEVPDEPSCAGSQISGTSLPQSPLGFSVSSQFSQSVGVSKQVSVWDFPSQVTAMLKYYAEKGDVQMSVTIILVFGASVIKLLPQTLLVQWFMSYIELLQQFQLLSVASYIINRCPLKEVNESSQQSTMYIIGCGRCNKPLPPQASKCQKCNIQLGTCSVCHTNVQGLFSWCDVCGHGGHYKHLLNWFDENSLCPAGCGHSCIH